MAKKRFYIQKTFIPACVTGGPFFIIIGLTRDLTGAWFSLIGCFMLAVGCGMLFKMVIGLEKIIDEMQEKTQK